MKQILTIGILCFLAPRLSAQTTNEKQVKNEVKYNQHEYEIGIDVKSIFSLQGIGSGLIFKKRIGEKKYINVYEKRALRLSLGGAFEVPTNAKVEGNSPGNDVRDLKSARGSILAGVGLEWQKQRERIQFFYGGDCFAAHSTFGTGLYSSVVYISDQNITANVYYDQTRSLTTGVNGFGGIRFFFSPRFSVSAESGMLIGYRFGKTRFHYTYVDSNFSPQKITREEKAGSIVWQTQYLRSLYFSYYF